MHSLTDYFWTRLKEAFGDRIVLNGHPVERLPNTLNVSFVGMRGYEILEQLSGVAASTGSACHAGQTSLSPVLQAMGVSERIGLGAVRFSLGRYSTQAEIDEVMVQLVQLIGRSR